MTADSRSCLASNSHALSATLTQSQLLLSIFKRVVETFLSFGADLRVADSGLSNSIMESNACVELRFIDNKKKLRRGEMFRLIDSKPAGFQLPAFVWKPSKETKQNKAKKTNK